MNDIEIEKLARDTVMLLCTWKDTELYQMAVETVTDSLRMVRDSMFSIPDFYEAQKWMKHEFFPLMKRDPRLEEFHQWLTDNIKMSLRVKGFFEVAQPKPFDKTQTWKKLK